MDALLIVVIAVVLTALTIVVACSGARRHQEDLNTHGGPARSEPAAPRPVADRPADAEAEPMGVDRAGEPTPASREE